ncbi:helix-turn-helix transcriptional regulator [Paenibacillus thiaminolyticus]|uniref:helix-turn-helix transcriptional regulator n=1 Tax=Paenibacillus thiaminolyticus TaxID=49283 RepID=UPI003D272F7A
MRKNSDSIFNKVYEYRVLRKMSQSELAEVVGVSKQTIFVMEKNNYVPSLLLAYRIANFFGVSIEEIFTYTEGGNNNAE